MPKVLLLTSLGCKPCPRVKRILGELQAEIPELSVEEIEFSSPVGRRLAMENSILYPPAVFLEGKLLVKGKIHGDELIAAIRAFCGVR